MAYNFPNSPSNGDTVTVNNVTYTYNSTLGVWSTAVAAPTEPAISSDGATPSLTSGITAIEVKNLLGIPTDISNVIDGAPSTLNTLDKLAAAINDDANFHTNVAPLVSPGFTGAPTAPTATTGTNTTQLATTEFVQTEISGFTTLTGLSVTSNTAAGGGTLTYDNTTGVFTYTPPSLAFSNISSTPTTIAGYGITDAFNGAFSSLTGVPTTISGYGITDAFDGVFASLTAKPSTIAGYGITDAFDGAFSSLTGVPTTISGYGITDAFNGAFSSLTGVPTTISGYGITDAFDGAFSSLTGVPTTVSGYGITDTYTTGAHLIPTANETYDLGSSSNKFRDLYLSGTSIHLGSQEITSDSGGVVVSALKIGSGANQVTLSASNGELQSGSNSYLIAGSDLDLGSNNITTTGRIYFANMFSQTSDLPSATTYHGMFAHVHSAGAAYFAHGGNWIELANKSYVDTEVAALVNSAPATLDTLDELAAALNDDANFATTVTTSLSQKAPLQNPALTGTPTAPTAGPGTNNTQIATTAYVDTAVAGASGTYSDASVDTHLNTSTAATNEVLSWNGSDYDWVAQATGGGGASVSTSDAPPSSPSAGDLWYNTDAGGLFVYYTDADSSQWVEVVGKTGATGATGATGGASITRYANVAGFPGSPTAADLAYANDTNTLYLYNGTSWEVVASGNDESPVITTEPPTATQALNSDGTTSTVTMVAQDPEGFAINYGIAYKTANNALPSQLASATSINQSTGVYTFTPTTTTSNAGTFRARLSASDGARTTTRFVDFSLDFTVLVDYLVVAGGGGGQMGGGGGGGVLQATGASLQSGTSYAITVGAGGDGWKRVNGSNLPTRGGSSIIAGIATAIGGGAGGGNPGNLPTNEYQSGGSGGGAGHSTSTSFSGGKGIYPGSTFLDQARQGYDGGNNKITNPYGQGGGGGAGGAGGNASGSNSGNGGAGVVSSITGSNVTYAGGGGGGGWAGGTTAGSGGSGGGGAGSTADGATASNGTAGLGSGGGGGSIGGSGGPGGYGGSGVVIIRTLETAASTTGSPTVTTDGSYNIYKFTSDGSITF